MSILGNLLLKSKTFKLRSFELNEEEGTIDINVYVVMPHRFIDEDIWYGLDDGFADPETGTRFAGLDFDGDKDCYWGRFIISVSGDDRKLIARRLTDLLSQLT